MFCGSSSRCYGLVCSMWLLYFLTILTYVLICWWRCLLSLHDIVPIWYVDEATCVVVSCHLPCGHLLWKGWPLGCRLWCLLWVCHFLIGILDHVWYLIVSIPYLCAFTYFVVIRAHLIFWWRCFYCRNYVLIWSFDEVVIRGRFIYYVYNWSVDEGVSLVVTFANLISWWSH